MSQVAEYDQIDNPYSSSTTLEPIPEVTESELRAFVGPRADYYLRKWGPRLEDPNEDCGMNWAAFFLTAFWMAYRKMYAATFLFYGVAVLVAVLERVLFVGLIGGPATPAGVGLIINILVSLVCGLYANSWYLAHARRKIAAAHAQGLRDEHLTYTLMHRGGTSLLASLGIVLVATMLVFVAIVFFFVIAAVAHAA